LNDDPVLAEVTRSGVVESVHRGRVAALDAAGRLAVARGAVDTPVLLRSCAKPLQTVAMVRAGLDVDGAGLAIACASHDGTVRHVAVVRAVLDRAGLDPRALQNAAGLPLEPRAHARQLIGDGPDRLHHNCSGKHAAMLATCVVNGWPTDGYLDPGHPLQVTILTAVAALAGEAVAGVAVDGCGAPIGAISVVGLARAFARIASAEPSSPEGRVAAAIRAHPDLVGGDEREVTRLLRAVPGLIAKDGAEGCYTAATDDGRAVAVKVADGGMRACVPVVVATLRSLGITGRALSALAEVPVLGGDRAVGSVRAVV
jgi:L-asparaginase II